MAVGSAWRKESLSMGLEEHRAEDGVRSVQLSRLGVAAQKSHCLRAANAM